MLDEISPKQIKAFWSKVDAAEPECCWDWTASLLSTGYGQFRISNGRNWRAHRLAYALTYGPIPEGRVVMHSCDNRRCVNPRHLQLGTQKQNLIDMALRGRTPRPVLTAEAVADCRRRAAAGESIQSIADSYGAKPITVDAAVRGRNWAHIADPPPVPPPTRRPRRPRKD